MMVMDFWRQRGAAGGEAASAAARSRGRRSCFSGGEEQREEKLLQRRREAPPTTICCCFYFPDDGLNVADLLKMRLLIMWVVKILDVVEAPEDVDHVGADRMLLCLPLSCVAFPCSGRCEEYLGEEQLGARRRARVRRRQGWARGGARPGDGDEFLDERLTRGRAPGCSLCMLLPSPSSINEYTD
ncbi:uncharacterized protein LOC119271894 [Triticum dicoccoides]|uniref:uncharacterized protein LOC119271894 n=1 Tax=Triticum dicoccoides TaxID=85692 RepID=UPI00188E3334|nr:uncharacterized protein LOC119271894 [Triticum dicoccoides]XP_044338707.1 uncharacterized protein LOC123060187 [Triticum aestivum]